MDNSLTELVFILDKSGSMAGLESDTIGGFNALLAKQKNGAGEANVTTVLFNHGYDLLHDRIPIDGVSLMTDREYEVGGTTALLDAIGSTINKIGNAQKRTAEDLRAGKVMVVITTDGMENSSREYSAEKIRTMIGRQKSEFGWEFIFLGANIDALSTAGRFGIDEDFAVDYHADEEGTDLNFKVMSEMISSVREGRTLDRNWKKEIEADFKRRKR
ncbi:vWA domain-containing protein [Indiicoccus explosivorum]|uniref:vWA domain-containing protein n=1 Tax=Indiicoccus explosivorum TaxID=1917864 RepID=UPI000B44CB35|nr:vWA domain-containing protein [Indiicoccus explosivorum]